jgi:hypothetical protein
MEQTIQVSVDEEGGLRVPSAVWSALGRSPGELLVAEEADTGEIVLRVRPEGPAVAERNGLLVAIGEPTGDIAAWVEQERERRHQELLARIGQ